MMAKKYAPLEMEIIVFDSEDVIITSGKVYPETDEPPQNVPVGQ